LDEGMQRRRHPRQVCIKSMERGLCACIYRLHSKAIICNLTINSLNLFLSLR
jgi:hypothetical protein